MTDDRGRISELQYPSSVIRPLSSDGAIAQLGERLNGIQEVGGSTPPGSTSLRPLRGLRLGKPAFASSHPSGEKMGRRLSRRSPKGVGGPSQLTVGSGWAPAGGGCMIYVYILQSLMFDHF